jgi:hypothetical protein
MHLLWKIIGDPISSVAGTRQVTDMPHSQPVCTEHHTSKYVPAAERKTEEFIRINVRLLMRLFERNNGESD